MSKIEHEYTKEIVCPYCGEEVRDGYDFEDECGEWECNECGKKYNWSRIVTVEYSTHADCKDNNNKHDWGEWDYVESDEDVLTKGLHEEVHDFYMRNCTKCDEQEFMALKTLMEEGS